MTGLTRFIYRIIGKHDMLTEKIYFEEYLKRVRLHWKITEV